MPAPFDEKDNDRFLDGLRIISPRLKKMAENEQARGRMLFAMLRHCFEMTGGDFKKRCQIEGYDIDFKPLSIDEIEAAAKEVGLEGAKEFLALGEEGENRQRARQLGYL